MPHWVWSVNALYGRALHRKEASPVRCKTVMRRVSCSLLFAQPAFAWHTRARQCVRCLSGEGAARALAPCRAGYRRSMSYGRAMHQQAVSPLQYETVVRRASCGLHFAQSPFAWRARARHSARCLSGGGAARALPTRAPCCADPGRSMRYGRWKSTALTRGLFLPVQYRSAMCKLWPSFCAAGLRVARAGATALAVS